MSYRCKLCQVHVPHRTPMLRHTEYRHNALGHVQIARETPVCKVCHEKIGRGEKPERLLVHRFVPFVAPRPKAIARGVPMLLTGKVHANGKFSSN